MSRVGAGVRCLIGGVIAGAWQREREKQIPFGMTERTAKARARARARTRATAEVVVRAARLIKHRIVCVDKIDAHEGWSGAILSLSLL